MLGQRLSPPTKTKKWFYHNNSIMVLTLERTNINLFPLKMLVLYYMLSWLFRIQNELYQRLLLNQISVLCIYCCVSLFTAGVLTKIKFRRELLAFSGWKFGIHWARWNIKNWNFGLFLPMHRYISLMTNRLELDLQQLCWVITLLYTCTVP